MHAIAHNQYSEYSSSLPDASEPSLPFSRSDVRRESAAGCCEHVAQTRLSGPDSLSRKLLR